jgi:hypothetical protein
VLALFSGYVARSELVGSLAEYVLVSTNQVRIIRNQLYVSLVGLNLVLVGPCRQNLIIGRVVKERRGFVQAEECEALDRCGEF